MNPASPAELLTALIACQSLTPHDGGAYALIENWLRPLGFSAARQVFSAAGTPDVENFYASSGGGAQSDAGKTGSAAKHLLFAGHVDVVPAGDAAAWRLSPFSGAAADGFIYGRGAVDMKGGIACFIAALARLAKADNGRLPGRISLLLTADEEGPGINGTVKALAWAAAKGEKWDAALVGEPSSAQSLGDMIKIGRRGSLSGILRVAGRQGHVAYPERAANPLPALLALIKALTAEPLDRGNADFQPSNLELTGIDTGNKSVNVIPAAAEARFNIRFNSNWTIAGLKAELAARLAQAAADYALPMAQAGAPGAGGADKAGAETEERLTYTLDYVANPSAAFITRSPQLMRGLAEAVRAITGRVPQMSTGGGTSDARFIKDYCPVAELGLVGATMHKINERASLADLESLTQIYQHFIASFFAAG